MNIAVIDNYDSFTYNLVQILRALNGGQVEVFRNDRFQISDLERFDALVLSPGPGLPKQAGLLMETINYFWRSKPILGVCLGHQAICEYFGASLRCLDTVYHGVSSSIEIDTTQAYFEGLPPQIHVGRYHSWVVDKNSLQEPLIPIAFDKNQEIMAVCHIDRPILGVQFHPESIMTPKGKQLIQQFLKTTIQQTQNDERKEQVYP